MALTLSHPAWPGWRHLPRETRDTLFLLGVIAWTVLPHVPRLPLWCTLLTAAMLLWRARLALANAPLPPRWIVFVLLVAVGAATAWSHRTLLGKEAGVTLVVAMMALKTLELRARRDAFVVFFLGFFVVLTQFLQSQSIAVAAAMLVAVWGLLTALVLAHMPAGQPAIAQAGRLAARTALLGAPIMALLFLLFPRIGPLWGVPQDTAATTGLGERIVLGDVAELALDDSVALRLRFTWAGVPFAYRRGTVTTPARRVTLESACEALAISALASSTPGSSRRCSSSRSLASGTRRRSSVLTKKRYPLSVGMRPAEVCGEVTKPSSSRSAMTLRTVAELRVSPDSRDSVRDPTGMPSRI